MKGSIKTKVLKVILNRTREEGRLPVYLSPAEFDSFLKEVEPEYKEQYGGFVCHEGMAEKGYTNILFMGAPICLDDLLKDPDDYKQMNKECS